MSSPTTSRPAASTSTPEIASRDRVGLRRKGATHTAVRMTEPRRWMLIGEDERLAQAGDWVVLTPQGLPLAILPAHEFPGPFELVAEGTLTLSQADRELLEKTTGVGSTRSAADLVGACQRLARIKIGTITIPFTPGQLEEIQQRAAKRGQTVQQTMQAIVDRIQDEIFWKS